MFTLIMAVTIYAMDHPEFIPGLMGTAFFDWVMVLSVTEAICKK